ncbi:MAG: hypothetical protein M1821_009823 [Bathelium mastoideum]|nr:MAG: hypothetical protein M1821_009823 [Bathelium mastoideum]
MDTVQGEHIQKEEEVSSHQFSTPSFGYRDMPGPSRTMSNTPSILSVTLHGNCPHCRHWHNKAMLRLIPGQYQRINCDKCSKHWFSLGGNSTHSSLLSQETRASGTEDIMFPSINLAICSATAAPLAVAAPSIQDTSMTTSAFTRDKQGGSGGFPMVEESNEPGTPLLPSPRLSNDRPSTSLAAPMVKDPDPSVQAPSRPQIGQDSLIPEGQLTSSARAPKPPSRFHRRLKKILAHLGVDVEIRISRIKRRSVDSDVSKDIPTTTHPRQQTHEDSEDQLTPHPASARKGDDRKESLETSYLRQGHEQRQEGTMQEQDPKAPKSRQRDTRDTTKNIDASIAEARRQKRRLKTRLARDNLLMQVPVRCECPPNCPCKRESESSVHRFTSRSTPDLYMNSRAGPSEFGGQNRVEFEIRRHLHNQYPAQRADWIAEVSSHAIGPFTGAVDRPQDIDFSEDGHDQSEKSRQASHTTATSHHLFGGTWVTESPRGSETILGGPVAAAPSPAPILSTRPSLHRSSTQGDTGKKRLDSDATNDTTRDYGRSKEGSVSEADSTFDRRDSSGTLGFRGPGNRFASFDIVTSRRSLEQLRRPVRGKIISHCQSLPF